MEGFKGNIGESDEWYTPPEITVNVKKLYRETILGVEPTSGSIVCLCNWHGMRDELNITFDIEIYHPKNKEHFPTQLYYEQ